MKRNMKRKGRYVVEAAFLIPGICMLMVYIVFFTLYTHDYAVCIHTVLETGIKGSYQDGRTNERVKEDTERELTQKLSERLLWLQKKSLEVKVSPSQISLRVSGSGSFLPVPGIEVQQKISRIRPCGIIRRSRWIRAMEEKKNGDTI